MPPGPLPRWLLCLPLLAAAAWWPIAPYWQSDDFLAVHYVQDGRAVLRDFVGPQYGATDVWAFYRPLITASFWLEQQLGGPFPPLSHIVNVLAHALGTLLTACIWRRWLSDGQAAGAALLWAVLPSHQGTICWAVGRVDGHTTVWCLLALLLALRRQERRLAGAPSPGAGLGLATAAALLSKELALTLPALATLAVAAREPGPWRARLTGALRTTAPSWLVLLAYLPWRWYALGRFGGYDAAAAALQPWPMLQGLIHGLANVVAPARWTQAAAAPTGAIAANAVLALVALALATARTPRLIALGALAFLVALLPMASFLPAHDNPQTLRLWYLPTVALCGLLAAGGRAVWLLVAAMLPWLVSTRSAQGSADRESTAIHRSLLALAPTAAEPLFVAGMPHANAQGTAIQLHFGVDRLLQPPFTDRPRRLCALRPLDGSPLAFRLTDAGESPWPLPAGSTFWFDAAAGLVPARPASALPELQVTGDDGGVFDLSTARLDGLLRSDATPLRLYLPGGRTPFLRVTVFTANGYLATVCENHAAPDASDGLFDARMWFADIHTLRAGRIAAADTFIGDALVVPTTIDLVPEFPVLFEGGVADGRGFRATHRATRLLTFRCDRGYPGWVRRAQGRER